MKKVFVKPEMRCHKLHAGKVLVGSGNLCAVDDSGGIGDCIVFCEDETCSSDHSCVDHPCTDYPACSCDGGLIIIIR